MAYLAEVRHQVPETPAWVAERHPVVIIANATSVLQHGIEYGITTQDSTMWQRATSAVETGLRSCQQIPIQRATNVLSCEEWYKAGVCLLDQLRAGGRLPCHPRRGGSRL